MNRLDAMPATRRAVRSPRGPKPADRCAARSESVNACLRVPDAASLDQFCVQVFLTGSLAAPPATAGTPTRAQRSDPPASRDTADTRTRAQRGGPLASAVRSPFDAAPVAGVTRVHLELVASNVVSPTLRIDAVARRHGGGAPRASGSACRRGWRGERARTKRGEHDVPERSCAGYPQAGVHGLRARRRTATVPTRIGRIGRCAR